MNRSVRPSHNARLEIRKSPLRTTTAEVEFWLDGCALPVLTVTTVDEQGLVVLEELLGEQFTTIRGEAETDYARNNAPSDPEVIEPEVSSGSSYCYLLLSEGQFAALWAFRAEDGLSVSRAVRQLPPA